MTVHAGPVPVTRIRAGRDGDPARSARVTVEIELAGGGAPGVASALCAEISDLLAGHARSGDTSVSASVSLGFGDAATRPAALPAASPAPPRFSGADAAAGDSAGDGVGSTAGAGSTTGAGSGAGGSGAGGGAGGRGLRIVAGRRVAIQDGIEVPLTRREFDLLSFLARHPRQVFSRGQLIDAVWGARYRDSERTIDVHVRRIRVKLSPTGPRIVTVRGVGYRLDHADRVAVVPGVD
ncbi:helix-turn-helix domain-containing protein [Cryptosporangium japonicum]|uniref:OmpR/PhoB-type domain-containing protein n=1 Tax=Cryptosporangium japonicum TaxID=80872 RepID=A0ABP3EUX2_9ACTN